MPGKENLKIYLIDVAIKTNMLLDNGAMATFAEVYDAIESGQIVEWLESRGCDMSILLHASMSEEKDAVVANLQQTAEARRGRERRKLGVEKNGLCLLLALALDAHSIAD